MWYLPAWAVFSAPQSLQPSPHMITCRLHFKFKFVLFLGSILPESLEALNQLNLLLWEHPRKDLATVHNPLEQLGVLGRFHELTELLN